MLSWGWKVTAQITRQVTSHSAVISKVSADATRSCHQHHPWRLVMAVPRSRSIFQPLLCPSLRAPALGRAPNDQQLTASPAPPSQQWPRVFSTSRRRADLPDIVGGSKKILHPSCAPCLGFPVQVGCRQGAGGAGMGQGGCQLWALEAVLWASCGAGSFSCVRQEPANPAKGNRWRKIRLQWVGL